MPTPFPGMDPYLEGYLWPDVHQRLATEISRRLAPRLRPRYVARLAIRLVDDPGEESDIHIMYPDVEIIRRVREPAPPPITSQTAATPLPPTITRPLMLTIVQVRLVTVEIRDTAQNELITSIEILSPVNKREPGLSEYRRKRQRLRTAGIHLLELDLLRRGERPFPDPRLRHYPYLVTLTRAGADQLETWPIRLADPLPTVAVPLRTPDADIPLELGPALQTIYDEAAYDLSIDYSQPSPPPPFTEAEQAWITHTLTHQERADEATDA